jgi:hypothetical protein
MAAGGVLGHRAVDGHGGRAWLRRQGQSRAEHELTLVENPPSGGMCI